MDSEDNVYIPYLDGDDQLLISDVFPNDRRQIFTLEDMQGLEDIGIVVENEQTAVQEIKPAKNETVEEENLINETPEQSTNPLPIAKHFLLAEDETQFEASVESYEDSNREMTEVAAGDDGSCFVEHMDIRAPVGVLRTLLHKRLNYDLSEHQIWLQNAQKLETHKNLVDQCVQGEGTVQINVEIVEIDGEKRINIVDVLKPTEEFLEQQRNDRSKKKNGKKWVIDYNFTNELKRLRVPTMLKQWSREHVKMWLVWAVRMFNLSGVKLQDWLLSGKQLLEMPIESLKGKCRNDSGDFWTHLELLKRCNLIAVVAKKTDNTPEELGLETPNDESQDKSPIRSQPKIKETKRSRILGSNQVVSERRSLSSTGRVGVNGQIQLWQFLLELLTDKNHQNVIHWVSSDGEFKLRDPEMVAKLWGERKNKPAMSYEKLSRALRYYYDGDMISKVHGKRFVYKFVCDLKELLGYSPSELNELVIGCAIKNGIPIDRGNEFYEHM